VANVSLPDEVLTLAVGCNPQLSPDGQTVYYIDDRPDKEGIYAVPRQGGAPRILAQIRLTERIGSLQFALSPDGQTIAYVDPLDEGHGLFILPASGGEPDLLVKLSDPQVVWRNFVGIVVPQWSPDGSQLAYADDEGLYVIPAAGGQPKKVAHLDGGWECWTLRWSPDGKFLAALSRDKDHTPNPGPQNIVFVVPAEGGELRQLTPDVEYKEGLEWHPDGQRLTYHVSGYESETRQAYLDGRPPSLLCAHPDPGAWDYVGAWEPDGRRFFFLSLGSTIRGICVYDEATGDITPFYRGKVISVPCWSRDGKTITWGTEESVVQLWMMEDSAPEPITAK
jgi:Tol biopolymer transport system component